MSDGSYIMAQSDQLTQGSLILVTQVTSTLTGAGTENENGGFGGMNGLPGGGGMDFGEFDFSNFDPGQMPPGGGDFPGMSN